MGHADVYIAQRGLVSAEDEVWESSAFYKYVNPEWGRRLMDSLGQERRRSGKTLGKA